MVHLHPLDKETKLPTAKVKKKINRRKLQPPDDRSGPDVRRLKPQPPSPSERTSGPDRTTGHTPASGRPEPPDDRHLSTEWKLAEVGNFRTSGAPVPESFQRTSGDTGRPVPHERPDDRPPADVRYLSAHSFGPKPMYPSTLPPFALRL